MAVEVPVRVFARPRPRLEAQDAYSDCIELVEERDELWVRPQTKEQQKWCPAGDQNFGFDGVLSEGMSTQESVYATCAEKVVTTVLEGYNGTVMAYGQTGAGKTYTMSGKVAKITNLELFHNMSEGPDKGIMQRAVEHVFKALKHRNAVAAKQLGAGGGRNGRSGETSTSNEVSVSYIEIYNDVVHDLLQEDTHSIALRKSIVSSESVVSPSDRNFPGVLRHGVNSRDHAMELLHTGLKRRQVASHNLNRDSSRSHAIFTLYITQKSGSPAVKDSKEANQAEAVHSRLDLVDLAGSERLSKTQSSGVHQSEAQHINKSLSFLEQVILAIGDPNRDHIPYRTCKLTQFLKESLGGNSYTVFIANVRLESAYLSETIRTCRFSQRMLNVKNSPILNVIRNDKNISQYVQKLVDENNHLKEELALYDSLTRVQKEYDPYTDEQRGNLYEQLIKYFNSDSWSVNNFAPLEFSSVRHIKEIILQCKAVYRNTSVPSAGVPASVELNGLANGNDDANALSENAEIQVRSSEDDHRNHYENHDRPSPVANGANGVNGANGSETPRSESSSSNGSVLDPSKIEAYKEGLGKQLQEALDENRMLVKTKKKESNMLAKQMNELIKKIKSTGEKDVVQALKADYRELHQERAMLLSEIDHCKRLAAECSKKLVEGVNQCLS